MRNQWLTGDWVVDKTSARQRRRIHYWLTLLWFTVGSVVWVALRDALWFVGFMSLYAIWISHLAGWAAETPVEPEEADDAGSAQGATAGTITDSSAGVAPAAGS